MIAIEVGGILKKIDCSNPVPVYAAPSSLTPWTCFGIAPFRKESLYSADLNSGCNCSVLTYCPHAHGTHIETSAHISSVGLDPREVCKALKPLIPAILIEYTELQDARGLDHIRAVCIRFGVMCKLFSEGIFDFTGTNPPCLLPEEIALIQNRFPSMQVLLVDLPSVDPESDGGALRAHRQFFSKAASIGIVELCLLPEALPACEYALSLNIAYLEGDATPCSPVLYPYQ